MSEEHDPSAGSMPISRAEALEATRSEIEALDRREAVQELLAAEAKASRHLTWAALGLSPAALIPFVGFLVEGSWHLIWPLIVLVFLVEGGRYLLARREVERLRTVVRRLRAGQAEPFDELVGEEG